MTSLDFGVYVAAAMTTWLALLLIPGGKRNLLLATLLAAAWPLALLGLAGYHLYLLLAPRDPDLPPHTQHWGRRKL